MTGGYATGDGGVITTTEVFIPDTCKTCLLPDLPDARTAHTMDTVGHTAVVCGGCYDINNYTTTVTAPLTSCLQFDPTSASSGWTNYASIMMDGGRMGHTSWVSSAGLVLMGGYCSDKHDGDSTSTEIVPSGGGNFSLTGSGGWY